MESGFRLSVELGNRFVGQESVHTVKMWFVLFVPKCFRHETSALNSGVDEEI